MYTPWNLNICANGFSWFALSLFCCWLLSCVCIRQTYAVAAAAAKLSSSPSSPLWYIITVATYRLWYAVLQCPASMDRPSPFHASTGWIWEHSFASVMYIPISYCVLFNKIRRAKRTYKNNVCSNCYRIAHTQSYHIDLNCNLLSFKLRLASNGIPPTVSKRVMLIVHCEYSFFCYKTYTCKHRPRWQAI